MIRVRTTKDIFQYSFGVGFGEFVTAIVTALLNYYYVRTMGLSNWWFLFAQSFYAIYNAVNDPMIGFITSKKYKFLSRWGKNYPWILIGGFGALISAIFIYVTPFRSQMGLVIWMIFTLCLTDTFYSIFYVNHQALSPVIFRTQSSRRKLGAISTVVATVCMFMGFIVPEFGDISSPDGYVTPMIIGAFIGTIMLLLLRPSIKEEKELSEELFKVADVEENLSFFKILREAIKHKNFMLFILLFLSFQTLAFTAIASLPYFVEFILKAPVDKINSTKTLIILADFLGIFVGVPIWTIVSKRVGFKITAVLSTLSIILFSIPIFFVSSFIGLVIDYFFIGIGVAGFWAMIQPLFTNTVDEITYALGEHREGVYAGIRTFFARFALIIAAAIFALVRAVTGFDPSMMDLEKITPLMTFGIRVEMIGFSSIFVLIATIIFAVGYNLDADKLEKIRHYLDNEMNSNSTMGEGDPHKIQ